MVLLLKIGRCYEAENWIILLPFRYAFAWYPLLHKFSVSVLKPWTIMIRCDCRGLCLHGGILCQAGHQVPNGFSWSSKSIAALSLQDGCPPPPSLPPSLPPCLHLPSLPPSPPSLPPPSPPLPQSGALMATVSLVVMNNPDASVFLIFLPFVPIPAGWVSPTPHLVYYY